MPLSCHLRPDEILYGETVFLRLPQKEELPFIRTLWNDIATMEKIGGVVPFPQKREANWYHHMIFPGNPADCYCLVFDPAGSPCGEISFHRWNEELRTADLNMKIIAASRGNGYAADALNTFLRFFFEKVSGAILFDDVAKENTAGQHLLRNRGFLEEQKPDGCLFRYTEKMFRETICAKLSGKQAAANGPSQGNAH